MFESLTEKLELTFKRLRGEGKISEKNIDDALREVRLALLEADVHVKVVKTFLDSVKAKSLGQEVLQSLTPEQQFLKIVRDELTDLLGGEHRKLDLKAAPPVVIMLVGLQGSGKTTTLAKLARHLKRDQKRTPYLVPADVYRPAAIEQLKFSGLKSSCQCMSRVLRPRRLPSVNKPWMKQKSASVTCCSLIRPAVYISMKSSCRSSN